MSDHTAAHLNRLARAASPYLLQHAGNPVDWWLWGPEALAEAKRTNRPILLSVGYAACHWCHVMAHESFEDEATAAVMNRRFVNIKVDREERPDIDQIYMAALHATGEQGGWPLTMFLTPDGDPFFGGTYFPKEARFGRPRFVDVLEAVAEAFAAGHEAVAGNVAALKEQWTSVSVPGDLPADATEKAALQLRGIMDPVHGGTRGAPKFPNAQLFELLLRADVRTGDREYRELVLRALNRIAMGGIYDHLGGGFARYSVDARWLVPHFEKMLYDNAQLLPLMADAHALTADPLYRVRCEETVDWLLREMRVDGLFAASLDADSEGEEGRFYVWTAAEVAEVLGADAAEFAARYDVTVHGNFEGVNVLNRLGEEGLADDETETFLRRCRARLMERREGRVRPGRDDKLLADWNGLTVAGLAHAGMTLGRDDWVDLARETYATAAERFGVGGRLIHAVRGAKRLGHGFALDHAGMIAAALSLAATGDDAPLTDAVRWVDVLEAHYTAPHGGYCWTADDGETLVVRPDSPADEAVPNANGLMVKNLATLAAFTGEERYERIARRILRAHARTAADNVFSRASLFNGLDQLERLATVTPHAAPGLAAATTTSGHPAAIVLERPPVGHPAATLLAEGSAVVCRAGVCSMPFSDATALLKTLWAPA
jgi:hypothetical protein